MTYTTLDKARAQLVIRYPFFATLVLNTELKIADNYRGQPVPTAATDGRVIVCNPKFLDTLNVGRTVFLLAHEAMHIAMEHSFRRLNRDPALWNDAADYKINHLLVEDGMEFIEGGLLDDEYIDSAEGNYDKLLRNPPPRQKGGIGDDLIDPNLTPAEALEAEQRVRTIVAQAATMARLQGKLSAGLERFVGELLGAKLPWQDILREFMLDTINCDESWIRRNRRYDAYMPSRYSTTLDAAGVILDTSGSITSDDLNAALSEVRAIVDTTCPARLHIMCADTDVLTDQIIEAGQPFEVEVKGGGGTDMRVPLERMADHNPSVVVLLTDGYTPWPDHEPDYPLIVCCTTDADVPVGRVVRI